MSSPIVPATIVVDLKKYRIRIHRPTLHAIGDPKLIQLLVNPEKRAVAIRAVSQEAPADQVHRIVQRRLQTENSYEIYSRSFVLKLMQIIGDVDAETYRLTGVASPDAGTAMFSLDTFQKLESVNSNG